MDNLQKTQAVLSLVVTAAGVVVTLSEIWGKIGPDVKSAISTLVNGCKNVKKIDIK